jgi:hypothetical protein
VKVTESDHADRNKEIRETAILEATTRPVNLDEDVIPRTVAFLRERLGDEAEPAVALIMARDAAGTITYGKPLRTFDGRNTIKDAMEEAADQLNYLVKLEREWGEGAGMVRDAGSFISMVDAFVLEGSFPVTSRDAQRLAGALLETAERMRRDIERIEPEVTP